VLRGCSCYPLQLFLLGWLLILPRPTSKHPPQVSVRVARLRYAQSFAALLSFPTQPHSNPAHSYSLLPFFGIRTTAHPTVAYLSTIPLAQPYLDPHHRHLLPHSLDAFTRLLQHHPRNLGQHNLGLLRRLRVLPMLPLAQSFLRDHNLSRTQHRLISLEHTKANSECRTSVSDRKAVLLDKAVCR
jgi:hypothetical protein